MQTGTNDGAAGTWFLTLAQEGGGAGGGGEVVLPGNPAQSPSATQGVPGGAPVGTPGTPGPGGLGGSGFLLVILLFFVVMIVSSMLGQRREKRKRAELLSSISKHDRVQTIGGIIGTVVEVRDDEIILKVDENSNTRIRFARSAVQQVIKSAGGTVESGSGEAGKAS